MNKPLILVVDDQLAEPGPFRNTFLRWVGAPLEGDGPDYPWMFEYCSGRDDDGNYHPEVVVDAVARRWSELDRWSMVLLDVAFGDNALFGFTLLEELRDRFGAELPIVMLTSEERHKKSRAATGKADGYLPKPIEKGVKPTGEPVLRDELSKRLDRFGLHGDPSGRLVGRSLGFLKTLREARRAASFGLDLVLLGETGSGKTALGQFIHAASGRPGRYRKWSTRAGADQAVIEGQLFGHWVGAFSGANSSEPGVFEDAHNGTLLIDEIQNLGANGQQLLLDARRRNERGLREVKRLGRFPREPEKDRKQALQSVKNVHHDTDSDWVGVDVQLLFSTNVKLHEEDVLRSHGFRRDLLNDLGHPLQFPGLNDRRADIPLLFAHFTGLSPDSIDNEVSQWLMDRDWTNKNIPVLQRAAEYAAAAAHDFDTLHMHHLGPYLDHLDRPARADATDGTAQAPAPPRPQRSLSEAIRALGDADIPTTSAELRGKLRDLKAAAGPVVTALLRAAFALKTPRGKGQGEIKLLLDRTDPEYGASDAKKEIRALKNLFPELEEDDDTKHAVAWASPKS